jgi:tetratricopeptide (TPR) repeat protein
LRTTPAPAVQEATASAARSPLLETGGTESGVIRKYVWEGAFNAWKSSPKTIVIGTGVETFAFAFYHYRPQGHNLTSEWDYLYNKAHNEYLNFLATTGLFGLGSYIAIIGVFTVCFVRKLQQRDLNTLTAALFAGWVSVLVTNFFGFSVVATQLMFFLFPAFIFLLTDEKQESKSWSLTLPSKSIFVVAFASAYLLFVLVRFWQADAAFAQGYRMVRSGNAGGALPLLVRATAFNTREPLYHDELGALYATIAASAFESKDATTAAQFLAQSTREHDRALATSPQNVNFLKTRTKIYVTLSSIDPKYTSDAISALERSIALSPKDPKIYYNLAVLEGRLGEGDKAIEYLKTAIAMKPNYRDAYFALWVFYTEAGKSADAQQILRDYLTTVDPNDKDFQSRLPTQGL